jgi:hypothetical protein
MHSPEDGEEDPQGQDQPSEEELELVVPLQCPAQQLRQALGLQHALRWASTRVSRAGRLPRTGCSADLAHKGADDGGRHGVEDTRQGLVIGEGLPLGLPPLVMHEGQLERRHGDHEDTDVDLPARRSAGSVRGLGVDHETQAPNCRLAWNTPL